jgi:hypothetical protein
LDLLLGCDSSSKWEHTRPETTDSVSLQYVEASLSSLWKANTRSPHLMMTLAGLLKTQQVLHETLVVSMPTKLTWYISGLQQ